MELFHAVWEWWTMAVLTAQPRLPLLSDDARPVGAAAAIVQDGDGGRVSCTAYTCGAGDRASVHGGVADTDQGRHPTAGRRGVRGETGHGAALGDSAQVSEGSVRNALEDSDTEETGAPTGLDAQPRDRRHQFDRNFADRPIIGHGKI
jgi:hypothetical protein